MYILLNTKEALAVFNQINLEALVLYLQDRVGEYCKSWQGLSKREQECMDFLVRGFSAKHIAKQLEVSPKTIEFHIANIKHKFGVHNKMELINKVFIDLSKAALPSQ